MNPSNAKQPKSEKTRQHIIDTYFDLMLRKSWDKVTVKEIYNGAGITRGTFYQYFSSIYDLMEQIQAPLLEELAAAYQNTVEPETPLITPSTFEEKFNSEPPAQLLVWFHFCRKHRRRIRVLLSSNSDPYFIVKLKALLLQHIHRMMDMDGMPKDNLRAPFVKALTELHLLSVRAWLDTPEAEFLSIDEIINLINTMRVGANYLAYH